MFQNLLHLTSLLLVILVSCSDGVNGQERPCADFLKYKYAEDELYGVVRLPVVIGRNNVKIKFISVEETGAILNIEASRSDVIRILQTTGVFEFTLDFSSRIRFPPKILSIMFNNREICDNSSGATNSTINVVDLGVVLNNPRVDFGIPFTSRSRFYQESYMEHTSGDLNNPTSEPTSFNTKNPVQDNWLESFKFNRICGRREPLATDAVIEGKDVAPHSFPWLVALFDNSIMYICGGSLVSDRHVVTAAQCTIGKQSVFVELGKHNLDNLQEEGAVFRSSKSIVNHPEYNGKAAAHGDISIIILSEKVSLSNKITPICLWPFHLNHTRIIGTVAGWGRDMSSPKAVDVNIISDIECRNSNPVFAAIISETTFCAGNVLCSVFSIYY